MGFEGDLENGGKGASRLPYQAKKIGILLAKKNGSQYGFAGGGAMYELKSIIGKMFNSLKLEVSYATSEIFPNWADKDIFASIFVSGQAVGYVAGVDKTIAKKIGLKKDVALAEIELEALKKVCRVADNFKFSEFEKFPPLTRDLAFVVNEKVLYGDIKREISEFHEYIKEVSLFDIYQGEKIGAHNKNMAFSVVYRTDRTLTGAEVDEIQKKLVKRLEERFEARIRDF
jgi:phenylalanyl-tRNA synthetase beta chain